MYEISEEKGSMYEISEEKGSMYEISEEKGSVFETIALHHCIAHCFSSMSKS